jgi:cysteinyl-tRNA synthetase
MYDDFNTPEAIAVLFDLASEVNRAQDDEKQLLANTMKSLGASLNFLQRDPTEFLQSGSKDQGGLSPEQIEEQIAARVAAKQAKDFAQADLIRKTLLDLRASFASNCSRLLGASLQRTDEARSHSQKNHS